MSEAKCEVCGRVVGEQPGDCWYPQSDECKALGYTRLADRIREAKHLISVRMEGFPCADGDDCENLKTLQAIAAALEGKES